jgi:hypothetical protein
MGNADVPDDLDMMDWDQMDISVYDQGAIVTGCLSI